ncbi:heavy-metal-associated domain-containing protein [Lentibacillus cibarius]|uniref:Heavy-metal-associated domain-containing protein n=1 Tax=Lentibacillus cibarius TaxID=2583219 RepID=A0A549YGF1_9BACI|nr:heavy-metal-associated domain-containing protein [Lentibacillus cibarius]TRM10971.1 heavy-metal-associated domain-containing protein [Lentibacillus cibarius]
MQKAIINLETLTCPSCIQKIENALKGMNGIEKDSVEVLFNSSKVKANFDAEALTIESIEKAIEDLGYPVIKSKVRAA